MDAGRWRDRERLRRRGGITGTLTQPKDLILGRYAPDGELVIAGRTTTLRPDAARALAPLLTPAGPEHPWPGLLPPGWNTKGPTQYTRITPRIVVEVRVDVAATETRWRHGLRYLRPRPDIEPRHVPLGLDIETAR